MRKTDNNKKRVLANTYCQTVTMQLKIEEKDAEDHSKCSQTEMMHCDMSNMPWPEPTNATIVSVPSTELGDPPLLQKPQQTTMSGIQQIIQCFRSGTVQDKLILLKEVDTIFECQLCRSLFRGLPNLLEHRRSYCFSRQPDPVDPSQAMKELLEAVFPERDWQETSPVRTIHSPVWQDQPVPISHQQNCLSQKLFWRKPVVVLSRIEQPCSADQVHTVSLVSQETVCFERPQRKDDGKDGCISDDQDTIASKQPDGDLKQNTVSQSNPKQQYSSSQKIVDVELGYLNKDDDKIPYVPCLKKTFDCRLCNRIFMHQAVLLRHMRTNHNISSFRQVYARKPKTKPAHGSMEGRREVCGEPLPSSGESCHVCQKSLDKEANAHCHCSEVHRGLKLNCTPPVLVKQPISNTSFVLQKQSDPKPVKESPSSQAVAHFSKEAGGNFWMKDLFYCGMCMHKYSSQVVLAKHLSSAHKVYVLEDCRTAPARKVKKRPAKTAFDNVRVYCWLCGKNFSSRQAIRKHCYIDHRQKLQEIKTFLKEGEEPVTFVHELQNGFVARQTHLTSFLVAR